MDAARWARIKDAFYEAVASGTPIANEVVVHACRGDAELVREVLPLIEEHLRIEQAADLRPGRADASAPRIIARRFQVLARLGGGSFGDVFRVLDVSKGGAEFALKILRSSDPVALHYFKREFRSLADIYHRNLVRLHELIVDDEQWMFTMEFIDGIDFIRFLKAQASTEREETLRSCFLQLGEGLNALHTGGLLHRDVKPSNLLVTPAGRVVLLDFGLVHSVETSSSLATFAGTPDYMSPEQAVGAGATESSDWYAFGVLLYQSLTGMLPFYGTFVEVLRRKQVEEPPSPVAFNPDIPTSLHMLCTALLQREPSKRPSYAEIIRLLQPSATLSVRESRKPTIIGRDEALDQLKDALEATDDKPVTVQICGPSGIGKTAVLREFVARLRKDSSVVVFAGRCYESETVPYQALDDLIDHMCQYFRRLPRDAVERLLPRNFDALVKMFPVLAPFLSSEARSVGQIGSTELRSRALAALRELFGRLRERHRIVLAIDDLQWGDVDGCMALNDLCSSIDSPAVLAVFAYRSEDIASNRSLSSLRDGLARPLNRTTTVIDLEHLNSADCRHLTKSLLNDHLTEPSLDHIAEQSGGSPFLVQEIAQWINSRSVVHVPDKPFRLGDVVRSRIDRLSPVSQHLLELVAVAGRPTELSVLQLAMGTHDTLFARDELVCNRLLRLRTVLGFEEVEIYHDRIRSVILSELDALTLLRSHRDLARALESVGGRDPERIATHYGRAEEPTLCAKYALIAASRAVEVLAFSEAARFYQMAISSQTLDSADCRAVHIQCADALSNAGRGFQAAEHYIAACTGAPVDDEPEWTLRAAQELLFSGYVDDGLTLFRKVLQHVGITIPDQEPRFPISLVFQRSRLRLRGIRWRERRASDVPRTRLLRIDTCASVATGLALIDIKRGATLQVMGFLLALRAGEPCRIARALAMEAGYCSTRGTRSERRTMILLKRAEELAGRTGDIRAIGLMSVMKATSAWNAGRWEECYQRACAARAWLANRHERLTWERDTASIFEVDGLRWMGRWSVMKTILPSLVADARSRGDLYAESILQMHAGSCVHLADDEPACGRAGLEILGRWSNTGFHVEHLVEMHNQVEISLYEGDSQHAFELIDGRWEALRESLLLRIQTLKIQMHSLRARAALAAASAETSPRRKKLLLNLAERDRRVIEGEGAVWGCALAALIGAGAEWLSGRRNQALIELARAEKQSRDAGMHLHRATARYCHGRLLASEGGLQQEEAAYAELRAEGIAKPKLLIRIVAPGFGWS
jgi:eukaryotic-like serine/threonine-protein kinase